MKTINLQSIEIEEMVFAPNLPLVVKYRILDDLGNITFRKTAIIKDADIPVAGKTALNTLLVRLLAKLTQDEGIN